MSSFSPSNDRLKQLIEQIKAEASAEVRKWDDLMSLTESLLLEVGVQQYLAQRKARMVELEQQFEDQIRGKAEAAQEETDAQYAEQEPQAAAQIAPPAPSDSNARVLGDEVKVLPDPQGPPVHHSKVPEGPAMGHHDDEPIEVTKTVSEPSSGEGNWNLGLNDKIALTRNLFDGNSQDLLRVLSQVETMDDFPSAKSFVLDIVQEDYDWSNAGEHLERFIDLIEAYFLHKNVKN